jgi:hypothetical protein
MTAPSQATYLSLVGSINGTPPSGSRLDGTTELGLVTQQRPVYSERLFRDGIPQYADRPNRGCRRRHRHGIGRSRIWG